MEEACLCLLDHLQGALLGVHMLDLSAVAPPVLASPVLAL
jgi:hypothetical protein